MTSIDAVGARHFDNCCAIPALGTDLVRLERNDTDTHACGHDPEGVRVEKQSKSNTTVGRRGPCETRRKTIRGIAPHSAGSEKKKENTCIIEAKQVTLGSTTRTVAVDCHPPPVAPETKTGKAICGRTRAGDCRVTLLVPALGCYEQDGTCFCNFSCVVVDYAQEYCFVSYHKSTEVATAQVGTIR